MIYFRMFLYSFIIDTVRKTKQSVLILSFQFLLIVHLLFKKSSVG